MNNVEGSEPYFQFDEFVVPGNNNTWHTATQYGSQCSVGLLSALYFVLFWILGAAVLLTLFIGVVTTSMEEAQSQQKDEAEVQERVKELQFAKGISDDTISLYQVRAACLLVIVPFMPCRPAASTITTHRHHYTFQSVFDMLDLDGGGSIEEDELKIGLATINKFPSRYPPTHTSFCLFPPSFSLSSAPPLPYTNHVHICLHIHICICI